MMKPDEGILNWFASRRRRLPARFRARHVLMCRNIRPLVRPNA